MKISRRDLFRLGRPSFRLSDLHVLPDERLESLIPAIVDASSVAIDNGHVIAAHQDGVRVLYEVDTPDAAVWPLIDGHASLGDIAGTVAASQQVGLAEAFAIVRRVFLALVRNGICQPVNALDS